MKFLFTYLISSAAFVGCAATPENPGKSLIDEDLDAFVELMIGEFETRPENIDTQILDRRVLVKSPDLEGTWIYTQLNTGADKKVYRQRISQIAVSADRATLLQRSYTLKSPETFTDFWNRPNIFKTLTDDDIVRFANEGCVQKWTPEANNSWSGYVNPKTCIISSKRRNKQIRIEAESSISGDVYTTNERGFDMDMSQIWGSNPGEVIELKRN